MNVGGSGLRSASAPFALCAAFVTLLWATAPSAAADAGGCGGTAAIEQLESQARAATAAGDPRQFDLWKQASAAAGSCAQGTSGDARGWFTYAQASDAFLSLRGEAEIVSGAPAILAELDALIAAQQSGSLAQAARSLRGDVALTYRRTRDIVAARVPPPATPEPTISPILLRGRSPLGM
jgi:hypothetical protein